MDIKITHSWLKEYLDTKATPEKIAQCLSLCGPSVERINKIGSDFVYDIEVTTNRVDTASVLGIAKEAAAILPQFGIPAKLKTKPLKLPINKNTQSLVNIKTDPKLNKRVMAVVVEVGSITKTPEIIKQRLEATGMRSLNLIIDITNYVMLETGHPTHVFDYDKIKSKKLIFRLSKKGEKITTLDNKEYVLTGGDIVIDDGDGNIVDLPGIMGTKNSVVDENTKRIIFFIDNNDPLLMRKTSLKLGIRTMAVQLNEKSVDTELGLTAFAKGIFLYQNLAKAKFLGKYIDIYDQKPTVHSIKVDLNLINSKLGVNLPVKNIKNILESLGFGVKVNKNVCTVIPPTYRANDIEIPEDIVEEVARIYGYFNIPSILPAGEIPSESRDKIFNFETTIRNILVGFGGNETLTISLVSKELAGKSTIALKNPLGADTAYLQTSLIPSMVLAAKQNLGETDMFHLFQIANIYKNGTKLEINTLAGVITNCDVRIAKGIVEGLFEKLNIDAETSEIGKFEQISKNMFAYEFVVDKLFENYKPYKKFVPIPKYPAQIEDVTIKIPSNKKVGEVIKQVKSSSRLIVKVALRDIFKNAYTFRIWYQDPDKTLTDKEVEVERKKLEKLF
jgi:phenylalanyl-tRNA synthetase beta chain